MIKVAINGFGRIGRAFFRLGFLREEIEIVAVNDLGNLENLAYLLKYDTAYGQAPFDISTKEGFLVVEGKEIQYLSLKDAHELPWGELGIDVVVESTGVYETYEKSKAHIDAGAKKVVITAPVKDEPQDIPGATILMGVNEEKLSTCTITSNASCTTNATSPLVTILEETIGIKKALLSTVHGYTATQSIVDSPVRGSDFRRGRAAAQNIVPSSTGAAIATTKAVKGIEDFDGIAIRVPVVTGSLVDLTCLMDRETTREEINDILTNASKEDRWKGIFTVTNEQLVSSDIVGNTHASIADLQMTRVVGGDLVKVLSWYDNEMGYTNTLVEHVIKAGK